MGQNAAKETISMKLNDILNGLTILEATADLNADITDVC